MHYLNGNLDNVGVPTSINQYAFWTDFNMYKGEYAYSATANDWEQFISAELGDPITIADWMEFGYIYHSEALSQMEIFPMEIINDVIVVKLSDEQ